MRQRTPSESKGLGLARVEENKQPEITPDRGKKQCLPISSDQTHTAIYYVEAYVPEAGAPVIAAAIRTRT